MDIIKNNPFRIIGILVGTSIKEEHAKARKIKMYIEAEQEIPEDFSFPIIGKLDRSLENISDAISKLNLNNDRVNASLFWFYNGNTITDEPMFEAMKSSKVDAKEAVNAWEKLTSSIEITKRNASAFQNLSTLYLNNAFKKNTIYKNKLEKGITLKLMFLESDFFNDFIKLSSDETYKILKQDLQIYFLNQVYIEIEKIDKDLVDWFIDCISGINFVAKESYLSNFITKPIDGIKEKIEEVKRKRKENPASAYVVGKELFDFSENRLSLVKNILGKNDLQFTSLSDKISDEILQCGITYFKKYRDTSTDPSDYTMELFSKAKKFAIGSIAKQRCEENTVNLQEWIDEKPERDKQKKIAVDFEKIISILQKYDGRPETVTNADNLLTESIPHLKNIKNVLGVNDQLYLRLSTRIASQALAYIIEDINYIQSNIQHSYQLNNFKIALRNAILAANKIKSLDLEFDFKTNRLNDNYNTLAGLCRQLNVDTSSSSSNTTYSTRPSSQPIYTSSKNQSSESNSGCLKVFGIIIGIIILVNMCGSNNNNYDSSEFDSTTNYDLDIDTTAVDSTAVAPLNSSELNFNESESIENQSNISEFLGNQLENGASPLDDCFGAGYYSGNATLTIKNGGYSDAIVCLYSNSIDRTIRNEYVQKNSSFTMSRIPQGFYKIRVFYGNNWNPYLENSCGSKGNFESDINFSEFDGTEYFEDSARGYTNATITLYTTANGNASTSQIDQSTFFNK